MCALRTMETILYIFFICMQHQHLRDENEHLKVENSNLTKVASMLTSSMKDSMDTSKRFVLMSNDISFKCLRTVPCREISNGLPLFIIEFT